jgi:hypothetical protein
VLSAASRNGPYSTVANFADRRHLTVHHPARRDDVRARRGLRDGGARIQLERCVVVDRAVLEQESAVSVVGVLAEAAVRDEHARIAKALTQRADCLLHHAALGECTRSLGVLDARQTEEEHAAETQLDGLLHRSAERVDALVALPRHGADGSRRRQPLADERGMDELTRAEVRLANQVAQRRGAAQPAGSIERESHDARQRSG